jgi:HPt (histidine-containing phosphotransfer) domain-containing protein
MPDPSIIDPAAIENLRSLNPGDNDEFLREIVGIFLEDTPQRIAELEASLAENDLNRFTRAAHSIKGSSANLGASILRAEAEKLEHHARKDGLTEVSAMIASIHAEFSRAKRELLEISGQA